MDDEIKKQLDRIEMYARLGAKEVLNVDEVCMYTGLSKSRIYALSSERSIPHYRQGKLYFRKNEIEDWLTGNRIKTTAEIELEAASHCLLNRVKSKFA